MSAHHADASQHLPSPSRRRANFRGEALFRARSWPKSETWRTRVGDHPSHAHSNTRARGATSEHMASAEEEGRRVVGARGWDSRVPIHACGSDMSEGSRLQHGMCVRLRAVPQGGANPCRDKGAQRQTVRRKSDTRLGHSMVFKYWFAMSARRGGWRNILAPKSRRPNKNIKHSTYAPTPPRQSYGCIGTRVKQNAGCPADNVSHTRISPVQKAKR